MCNFIGHMKWGCLIPFLIGISYAKPKKNYNNAIEHLIIIMELMDSNI